MWDEAGRLTDWLGEVPVEAQLLKLSEEAHLSGVLTRAGLEAASAPAQATGKLVRDRTPEIVRADGADPASGRPENPPS
jgi:hypothetical protein